MKRDLRLILIFLLIMAAMVGAGYLAWTRNHTPSTETAPAFDNTGMKLIIGGDLIVEEAPPLVREGHVLLSFDTVKQYLDPYLWWDASLSRITVTTKDRVIRMETDKLDAFINDEPLELRFPAVMEGEMVYLPIEFLSDFYGITLTYVPETAVVILDRDTTLVRSAYPQKDSIPVRKNPGIRHPIVKTLSGNPRNAPENRMLIWEDYGEWYRVRCADGTLGFVNRLDVVVTEPISPVVVQRNAPQARLPEEKLSMAWEMMYSPTTKYVSRPPTEGVDILSPTWFQLSDAEGGILNRTDPAYIEWAHTNGWQVWALFSNDFQNIDATSTILRDPTKRERVIRQILAYVALYGMDGINIDFENIYKADKEVLTQFVRELTAMLREQKVMVSMAVSVPGGSDNWSLCFDRKALGETVDYLCLMAYDQHWSSSPIAGSTAELSWVEEVLQETLLEVPAEKLLLGIPLYSRLWLTTGSEGSQTVKSVKALGTDTAWTTALENDAQIIWDEEKGQYHATWTSGEERFDLWIEDRDSVNVKSALVHRYHLAGTAAWAMNFAGEGVWDVFHRNLKDVAHFEQWRDEIGPEPVFGEDGI